MLDLLKPARTISDLPIVTDRLKRLGQEFQNKPSVPVYLGTHLRVPQSRVALHPTARWPRFSDETVGAMEKSFRQYGAFYTLLSRKSIDEHTAEALRDHAQQIGNNLNKTPQPI